jgi:electron transport complex protein RnfG
MKAALFKVAERGYAGDIQVLMAVDMDGRTLGVRILKHSETPGLGDKIEVKKDDWVLDFNGKSLAEPAPEKWGVRKDNGVFDQFAGATITPRAVVKAVKGGLEFFAAHRADITG